MPDIHESSYNAWMGRKKTTLRRPTLDCGCVNNGEVSFHLWCDRLACQEHADAPHDCGEFKGSKSGIEDEEPVEALGPEVRPAASPLLVHIGEEEAVEPEAVPETSAGEPLSTDSRVRLPRDWPLHDHLPAENDWPGGNRYGYRRDRVFTNRPWSDADRERAAEAGIELPEVDWLTVEMWWDMPREHTVSVESSEPLVFSAFEAVEPVAEVTLRQTVRTAKRYGKRTWATDPFRAARAGIEEEAVPAEAVVESPLVTLDDLTTPTFVMRRRTPEGRRAYLAEQRTRHVEHGAPPAWLELFDELAATEPAVELARGPEAQTELGGSAPTDRVADAFRAEVLRQGLAPCEIEIDGRSEWVAVPGVVMPAGQFDELIATIDEPEEIPALRRAAERRRFRRVDSSAALDELVEPNPDGPREMDGAACSPAGASPQGAVTSGLRPAALKSEIGSRLAGEPQRPDQPYAARPWWRPRWW